MMMISMEGVALQMDGRMVLMVPPQLEREVLKGITCSLSQVNRGCCMVGAPQIWVSSRLVLGSLCNLEHVA